MNAPRCDALRSALRGPMQCAAMSCAAPCFSRGTGLGEVPGQAREKLLSASCACFRFLGEIPQAQPSIPFNPFWRSGPSILSSRFFLLEKAAQASSSSVSSFRIKQSRHPLLSFLPFEKSCQTPPRPPLSPLKKAAGRSFFLFLSLKATMCIRLHAPRRWA